MKMTAILLLKYVLINMIYMANKIIMPYNLYKYFINLFKWLNIF